MNNSLIYKLANLLIEKLAIFAKKNKHDIEN